MKRSDLDDFVNCYCAGHMEDRKETWSEENLTGRWRKYDVKELLERDKTSLDISWIKDKDDLEDVTLKELFSTIQEKGQNINNAINQLAGLLSGIEE